VLLVVFSSIAFLLTLGFIREGVAVMCIGGTWFSIGEVFLRFREALLSRESELEELWEDSESESGSDWDDESDASSDMLSIVADLARALCAAII